jgi:hypothetical protein
MSPAETQAFFEHDRDRFNAGAGPQVLMCTAYQEDLQELKRHAAQ